MAGSGQAGGRRARNGGAHTESHPGHVTITDLYRGRAMLGLIRDLALGEWTYSELAKQIGVPTIDITAFAEERAEEIQDVRAALAADVATETAGLWITNKAKRIAEIQSDFEDTQDEIAALRRPGLPANLGVGSRKHYNLNRIRLALLSAVSQELEPRRTGPKGHDPDSENTVRYVIEAEDIAGSLS